MTTEARAAAQQMAADPPPPEHWTLDKKVPLAIILALLVQGAGLAWWAATLESRVVQAEKVIVRLEARDQETRESRDRLIRLEERMISAADELRRMNGKLEQLIDRPRSPRTGE